MTPAALRSPEQAARRTIRPESRIRRPRLDLRPHLPKGSADVGAAAKKHRFAASGAVFIADRCVVMCGERHECGGTRGRRRSAGQCSSGIGATGPGGDGSARKTGGAGLGDERRTAADADFVYVGEVCLYGRGAYEEFLADLFVGPMSLGDELTLNGVAACSFA